MSAGFGRKKNEELLRVLAYEDNRSQSGGTPQLEYNLMPKTLVVPELTVAGVSRFTDIPPQEWAWHSHEVSLSIVQSGLFPHSRIVAGRAEGFDGKHYWVSLNGSVYDQYAPLVDPTLWSHYPFHQNSIWMGSLQAGIHRPLGFGHIWDFGYPENSSFQDSIALPTERLSLAAKYFLARVGPLDSIGWRRLMRSPMQGWPSGEILAAMKRVPELSPLVPVDLEGMLTDNNPGGLYLP